MTTALLLAFFVADVTPPLGHPLCGGLVKPVERVADPLFARGFVLIGAGEPIIFCAVDWCEIHNDAYDRWRTVLAAAAGTTPQRVIVTTLHQHDAPVADLTARRLMEERGQTGTFCDPAFHETSVQRVAEALRTAIKSPRRVTHLGIGQAKVDKVASNRRVVQPDGKVHEMRGSSCKDEALRAAPEGLIDPWLKTLSFWDGDRAVLALSCYATHPMTYYGSGEVSSDFFGLARARRQADDAAIAQIMVNGCAGNLAAGKYNDGSPQMRPVLTDRVYTAMVAGWRETKRYPIEKVSYRFESLRLPPKTGPGWSLADVRKRIDDPKQPLNERIRAAQIASFLERVEAGRTIDVPVLDVDKAQMVVLPGEPFIEYQLAAQRMRPDSFVMVLGYGDLGPEYVPIDKAYSEGGYETGDWSFVRPGVEDAMMSVLRKSLAPR